MAKCLPEDPRLEEVRHWCERHRKQAHANVGHCKIRDENVSDCLHGFVPHDHKHDEDVACNSKEEDEGVKENKERHQPGQPHHLFIIC